MLMTNAKIYLGGYMLHGYSNTMSLQYGAEMLDDSVFGCSTRSNRPGMFTTQFTANIFWDITAPAAPGISMEAFMFGRIGAAREVLSTGPVVTADGDVCYTTRNVHSSWQPLGGAVGELLAGELSGASAGSPLIRGVAQGVGAAKVASGNATYTQIAGGVPVGKKLYGALHVVAASGTGTSLTCVVESDDNTGFSSPTTQLTFASFTQAALGADWQETAGVSAITDTYFRMKWTIAGGTPSFTILGVIGVL